MKNSRLSVRAGAFPVVALLALSPLHSAWADPPPAHKASKDITRMEQRVHERDVVEVAPDEPVTRLHVDNRLGDIRIEGRDVNEVTIEAYKRALDAKTLERIKVTLVPDRPGVVRVATSLVVGTKTQPIPAGSVDIDLLIRAPRGAEVEALAWDGRVELRGMENGAEIKVNEGDIEVENASGAIVTFTSLGAQSFSEVFGKIEAFSLSGRVTMNVVRGERLEARVHRGRINGRKVRVRKLLLLATKGDIRLSAEVLAGGNYFVGTGDGDIEVELSSRAPLSVRAYSRKGRVDLADSLAARPASDGYITGAVTDGKGARAVLELRSRVGNIQLAIVE